MAGYDNRALNAAQEENEMDTRYDNQEAFGAPGGDFWRLVWKRIESSRAQVERSAQAREQSLEPPRDYIVETDKRFQTRSS